jgi:hypothetical protein
MVDMNSTIKDKIYACASKISVNKEFPGEELENLYYANMVQYNNNEKDHKTLKDKISRAKRNKGVEFYLDNTPVKRVRILYAFDKNTWLVMDPRGFCVEVHKDNIAYVMRYCTVKHGVIEDECVWGFRSGHRLIAKESPEYELAKKATTVIKSKVSVRDIKQGNGILLKNGKKANYLGKIPFLGVVTQTESHPENGAIQWASFIEKPCLFHTHVSRDDHGNIESSVSKHAPSISSRLDEIDMSSKECLTHLNEGINKMFYIPNSISSGTRQCFFPISDNMGEYRFKLTKKNTMTFPSIEVGSWDSVSQECVTKLGAGFFIMKSDTGCSIFVKSRSGWACNELYHNVIFDSIKSAQLRTQTSGNDSDECFNSLEKFRIDDIVSFLNGKNIKDIPNIAISSTRRYKSKGGYYYDKRAATVYESVDSVWEVTIVDKGGNVVEDFT